MGIFFRRGANVPHLKTTEALSTVTMPIPEKIVLPMQQHAGAPCVPVVQKGDFVYVGTCVGRAQGTVSADIHSGVSGTVISIEAMPTITGAQVDTVIIQPDGQQTIDPAIAPPKVRDRESFIAAVRASGLVGLGGAGFPTAVKLSPQNPDSLRHLIVNAAECEPYITTDNREILECSDSLLSGIKALQHYLNIPKVTIAIERNKPEATELLFSLTLGDDTLSVCPLPSRYPQGAEKVLIEAVTGLEVPAGGLPADVGVLVMNVTTVSFIGKYLASGMPLVNRRITVDGSALVEPKNVETIIGTPASAVLEFCGGFKQKPAKILLGGPMMGFALPHTEFPVLKQNNALLAFSAEEAYIPPVLPCIRCGRCINACPMRLSPVELNDAYERKDVEMPGKLNVTLCMNCGVCSYVCPSKRLVTPQANLARLYYLKEVAKK